MPSSVGKTKGSNVDESLQVSYANRDWQQFCDRIEFVSKDNRTCERALQIKITNVDRQVN